MTSVLSQVDPFGITYSAGPDAAPVLSKGLSRIPVKDRSGAVLGTLCGYVIAGYCGAGLHVTPDLIKADFDVPDAATFEAQVLDGLHGAFVMFTHGALPHRLYPDCGGSIPIVFCAASKRLGSSAHMFLDPEEYEDRFNRPLHDSVVANDVSGSWITGTLTAHHGIERLLPNFYLDLERWEAVRFWPHVPDFALSAGLEDTADLTAQALTGFLNAVAVEYRTGITMTAGFDSRILIAAARQVRDKVEFFTIGSAGEGLDQDMTARISAEMGLSHRLTPIVQSSAEEKAQWDYWVGHVVRESTRNVFPTLHPLSYDVILTGMYGETGRARLYRQDRETINTAPATAEFVLSRLTLPLVPEVVENVEHWLAPIVDLPRSAVLDLAFNELRFGSWAMGQAPVQKAMQLAMMPFAQRSIQGAFMAMDPVEQGTEALFNAIGARMWPEVMAYPVNKYGDYRDWTSKLTKVLHRDKLIRFTRDRFAALK